MRLSLKQIKLLSLNKYIIFILIGFVLCESKGQNLIKNSSFESCSNTFNWDNTGGGFYDISVSPPVSVILNWETFNSPDYFSPTYPYSNQLFWMPKNIFGISYAKIGNAYAGIMPFTPNGETKEYLRQQLTAPLKQDSVYCLSFYTTRADRTPYAIKSLGAYFSINTPTLITNYYINAVPQVVHQNTFITDTIGWTEVQGCFTAQGGEQYITIGNFNSNANTDTLRIQSTNPLTGTGNDISYYYIDSVSLWKNNFPNDISEAGKENSFKVYPNPAKDLISINLLGNSVINNLNIKIVDILGEEVFFERYKKEINISFLVKGIYFLSLFDNNGSVTTKKIIKE
ncbi:MAG: T9SS type A sorting domain-containing protein [Nitrososphaeraceae archaeon]